jgi:Mg2+ and Co2+ transporter CorA
VLDTQTCSIPVPVYRHAAPSGPWPWVDFNTDLSSSEPSFQKGKHEWQGYPQELFGNWSPIPVKRSQMLTQCAGTIKSCVIYTIDVAGDGQFKTREQGLHHIEVSSEEKEKEFWSKLQEVRENVRVRALFVDNLSESVLKMLGTKYNIEPFFFSSSANWIPSRYQEEVQHGVGDHITVILPFIRTTEKKTKTQSSSTGTKRNERKNTIDVMSPLHLHGEHVLLIDLLAIHMIRVKNSSTIITYHPALRGRTTAERLHQVMERAGGSVYWNKISKASEDPTFFFLAILWYALYAWDEAFEVLYNRIKDLEVILNASDFSAMADLNYNLHSLQAHLLQYQSLLHDFELSVTFVMETPNPAMEDSENKGTTEELMQRECKNLLSEIDRLRRRCEMFISRLKNATDLAFATVNIEDSRQTFRLTMATLRDSAAMKQISYLTMIFLPASFTASVFGMNVREINPGSLETIARYVWVSLLLTFVTTWIVIALQPYSTIHKPGVSMWRRAAWPAFVLGDTIIEYFKSFVIKGKKTMRQENNIPLGSISGREGHSSTLKFDDAMFEEDAIGG